MKNVADILHNFLDHSVEPIRKPQELAQRMARLTHIIRDIIIEAFEQKQVSDTILDLYKSFKETLLPQLTAPEFADMFAQTLAYGLFAARYNHKSKKPFRREDAAKEIPRTNPFLRKLFSTIAGPDLKCRTFPRTMQARREACQSPFNGEIRPQHAQISHIWQQHC